MTELEVAFPGLRSTDYSLTSPLDPCYNCIAWAAGDNARFWWPSPWYFWPSSAPCEPSLQAFVLAYGTLGFSPCDSQAREPGTEKIAVFANDGGIPTHAARQLPSGRWTSKLGVSVDIEHELRALEGAEYGKVILFLQRPWKRPVA